MKNNNNNRIDEILESLDGTERATPGPYFFTRLQQRLNREENTFWSKIVQLIARPAVAFSVLMVVILLNVAVIFNDDTTSNERIDDSGDFYTMANPNLSYEETP